MLTDVISTRVLRLVEFLALFVAIATSACGEGCGGTTAREPAPRSIPAAPEATPARDAGSLSVPRPSPRRVVAVGDLHGDLGAARRVLRLAGAIDASDGWVGGDLVVVQTGDSLDRGDDDRAIIDFFERLAPLAKRAGGELVVLVGNHETMNVAFDFRYVTPGSSAAFSEFAGAGVAADARAEQGRRAAFAPGGPYARKMANWPPVARVGDTVFVHGGVLPKHVRYGLDRMIDETRAWFLGTRSNMPDPIAAEDGPLWSRMYSTAPGREECAMLDTVLGELNAKRMVMGHTVQKPGIQPACDKKAWRIDVGMSKYYGGPIQALEIAGEEVRVLAE